MRGSLKIVLFDTKAKNANMAVGMRGEMSANTLMVVDRIWSGMEDQEQITVRPSPLQIEQTWSKCRLRSSWKRRVRNIMLILKMFDEFLCHLTLVGISSAVHIHSIEKEAETQKLRRGTPGRSSRG